MLAERAAAGLLLLLTALGMAVLGLAVLGMAALGCSRSPEAVERARLLAAVDALRDAPAADARRRRGLLEALERQPAVAPVAQGVRDACAAAYRPLLDGTELTEELRRAVARGDSPAPELPQKLHQAEAEVARARTLMAGCERALADLRHARSPPASRALP